METKPWGQGPGTCILTSSSQLGAAPGSLCLRLALTDCILVSHFPALSLAMHHGPTCECFEGLLEPFPFSAHTTSLNEFQKVRCCLTRHAESFTTSYRFPLLLRTVSWASVALQSGFPGKKGTLILVFCLLSQQGF